MNRSKSFVTTVILVLVFVITNASVLSTQAIRRQLRVALYPYIPQKAEMYWRLETEFENAHPDIDLRYVDLGADYYGGQLLESLKSNMADVFEVDTVFLRDLVDANLVEELPPGTFLLNDTYLPVAVNASMLDGKVYGIPHWVCGNFLFFRKDDPERARFEKTATLDTLERILGRPFSQEQGLLVDLQGKSTLGEKYLDAVLDTYQTPDEALKHVSSSSPDAGSIRSLNRLFSLCPGGLCDSEKHHNSDQFYARQFAHRRARVLIGYSERMYYVVDEYLNGVREDEVAVGTITFSWNDTTKTYNPIGAYDIDAISAPLSDVGSKMLAWVDVLSIRKGMDSQTRKDASILIEFFNSEEFTSSLLIPEYGTAPRYLLPARSSLYSNRSLLQVAPIYTRFYEIMRHSVALTSKNLNTELRAIGKTIQKTGFTPQDSIK